MWKKYGTTGQATDDNKSWSMRFVCWITRATYTENTLYLLLFHDNNVTQCDYIRTLSCNRDDVHCTVVAVSVNIAQLNLVSKVVRSQSSPPETCSGQCGSGMRFSPGFPLSVSIYQCSILIFIYTLLLKMANGYALVEIAEYFHFSSP
jgi:hypothetical protein